MMASLLDDEHLEGLPASRETTRDGHVIVDALYERHRGNVGAAFLILLGSLATICREQGTPDDEACELLRVFFEDNPPRLVTEH